MIKGLHHAAYRCRDSEETRKFYEDFLGLPFVAALEINETKTGRRTQRASHLLSNGRRLLHRLLRGAGHGRSTSRHSTISTSISRSRSARRPRGDARQGQGGRRRDPRRLDHRIIHSIYFRDPNGYVVELTAKAPGHDDVLGGAGDAAQRTLAAWQGRKTEKAATAA